MFKKEERLSLPVHRNQSLDVLRCAAVLLVLGHHFPYYRAWAQVGWAGVDLFFVLSGFLISGSLFRDFNSSGAIHFRNLCFRRGFKIWPAFYFFIAQVTIIFAFARSEHPWRQVVVASSFLSNYFPTPNLLLTHVWTLAVEDHFYIALPLLLIMLTKLRRSHDPFNAIPVLFIVASALCLVFRWFCPPDRPAWATHMQMDSLFAGVFLGYLYNFRQSSFEKLTGHRSLVLAVGFCLPAAFLNARSRMMQSFGLTALFIGCAFLVAWSVGRTPMNVIGAAIAKMAAKGGFYSYSIYLWHTVVCERSLWKSSALAFWAYLVTAIAVGIAAATLIELHALALREKLFPSDSSVSPTIPELDGTLAVSVPSA
jgi:peptidoglycan/LPS O-acetylase OafA/YrhL